MTVAKEDDTRRTLTPDREGKLYRSFHLAWADVMPDVTKYGIWPRTRANMMFERLAVRLQEEFVDDAGVEFCFADETVKIIFDDLIVHAVLSFCEADEDLFGFTGLQKIEIVYNVNATGTGIRGIMVQARDGDIKLWGYRLGEAGEPFGAVPVTPFPQPPTPPPLLPNSLVQPRSYPVVKKETDEK
jgi:hypothetical protein